MGDGFTPLSKMSESTRMSFQYLHPEMVSVEKIDDDEKKMRARMDLAKSYEEIVFALKHYLDWSENEIKLHALWIIGTYFYKLFPAFPYKFVTAMKSSGKTRLLKMTAVLVHEGKLTAGMSDSALFRSAANHTLIFDEAEQITSKDKKSQRLILNAGYKRGACITLSKEKKVDGAKTYVNEDFDVYGPKMLANIVGMEDVLGSRAISSIMEKSCNPAKVRLIEDFDTNPFFQGIKVRLMKSSVDLCNVDVGENVLERWNSYISDKYISTPNNIYTYTTSTIHYSTLTQDELELFNLIDKYELDGRHLELYFPLFIVAKLLGEDILKEVLEIASGKVKEKKETELMLSTDIALIDFISQQTTDRSLSYVPCKQLTQEFKSFYENDDAKEITNQWMGTALNRLNLVTAKRRVTQGVEVVLNIEKAREKLKVFK